MKTVHAIYEKGVFRPKERVDLPERCEVEFEPKVVNGVKRPPAAQRKAAMREIFKLLSKSYKTGVRDLAARHNEHQP